MSYLVLACLYCQKVLDVICFPIRTSSKTTFSPVSDGLRCLKTWISTVKGHLRRCRSMPLFVVALEDSTSEKNKYNQVPGHAGTGQTVWKILARDRTLCVTQAAHSVIEMLLEHFFLGDTEPDHNWIDAVHLLSNLVPLLRSYQDEQSFHSPEPNHRSDQVNHPR